MLGWLGWWAAVWGHPRFGLFIMHGSHSLVIPPDSVVQWWAGFNLCLFLLCRAQSACRMVYD
jgi:hypothetical protein